LVGLTGFWSKSGHASTITNNKQELVANDSEAPITCP